MSSTFEKLSYQRMLRVVGAWLDDQRVVRFNLVETPEGLVVGASNVPDTPPVPHEFSHQKLIERELELEQRRKQRKEEVPFHSALTPEGRADFLHALGYELDAAGAQSILLDELDDLLLLTYSYIDASQGYLWRKRMITIDASSVREILDVAKARRSPAKGLLNFLR